MDQLFRPDVVASLERRLHLREEPFFGRRNIFCAELSELSEQRFFFVGEIGRCRDRQLHDKITAASAIHMGNALGPQPEALSTVRSGRNDDRLGFLKRRNFELYPKRCLSYTDFLLEQEIVTEAGKELMLSDIDMDVEVALASTARPCCTTSGETKRRP